MALDFVVIVWMGDQRLDFVLVGDSALRCASVLLVVGTAQHHNRKAAGLLRLLVTADHLAQRDVGRIYRTKRRRQDVLWRKH